MWTGKNNMKKRYLNFLISKITASRNSEQSTSSLSESSKDDKVLIKDLQQKFEIKKTLKFEKIFITILKIIDLF